METKRKSKFQATLCKIRRLANRALKYFKSRKADLTKFKEQASASRKFQKSAMFHKTAIDTPECTGGISCTCFAEDISTFLYAQPPSHLPPQIPTPATITNALKNISPEVVKLVKKYLKGPYTSQQLYQFKAEIMAYNICRGRRQHLKQIATFIYTTHRLESCSSVDEKAELLKQIWKLRYDITYSLRNPEPLPEPSAPGREIIPNVKIHMVRNGISEHSTGENESVDPKLDAIGVGDCRDLTDMLEHAQYTKKITHLISSPLTRALETAILLFEETWSDEERGVKIVPWVDIKEVGPMVYNGGTPKNELMDRFYDIPIAWDNLPDNAHTQVNPEHISDPVHNAAMLKESRTKLVDFAVGQAEEDGGREVEIGMVSHRNFLNGFTTNDEEDWRNCELRTFVVERWQGKEGELEYGFLEIGRRIQILDLGFHRTVLD